MNQHERKSSDSEEFKQQIAEIQARKAQRLEEAKAAKAGAPEKKKGLFAKDKSEKEKS